MEKVLRMLGSREKITPACVHANILFLCMHCLFFNSFACEIRFFACRDSPRDQHARNFYLFPLHATSPRDQHARNFYLFPLHATFFFFHWSIRHASILPPHAHAHMGGSCMHALALSLNTRINIRHLYVHKNPSILTYK
jgi:hypothetical protein